MKIRTGPSVRTSFILGVTFVVSSWGVARAQSAIPAAPATAGSPATEDVPPPPPVPQEPTSRSPSASASPSPSPVVALAPNVAVQDRRDERPAVNPPGPANRGPVVLLANAEDQTLVNLLRNDIKELNERLMSAGGRNDQDRSQTIYNVLKGEYAMLVGVKDADPGQLHTQQSAELRSLISQEVGRAGETAQAPSSAPAAAPGALSQPTPGADMSGTPGGTGSRPSPPVPSTNPGGGQTISRPVPGGSFTGGPPNIAPTSPGTGQVIHIIVPNTTPTTTVISPGVVTQPVVGSPVQILIPVGKHHRLHGFYPY